MLSKLHHPPHIFINNSWYFITAHTLGRGFPLKQIEVKMLWTKKLNDIAQEFNVSVYAYVLMDNHYHLICYFPESTKLPKFIQRLHGSTAYEINLFDNQTGRKIWHNYWDRLIRDEVDFYTKFNYVHYNPVKHGVVSSPEKWDFSSYNDHLMKKGEEWMLDCWRSYPVIDYDFEN